MGDQSVARTKRECVSEVPKYCGRQMQIFRPAEKPKKEMIDLAVQLIEQKAAPFKPEAFVDHYQGALKALVQEKMKGRKILAPEEEGRPRGANVVDLMEALKRSVGQPDNRSKPAGPSKSSPKSKKKA